MFTEDIRRIMKFWEFRKGNYALKSTLNILSAFRMVDLSRRIIQKCSQTFRKAILGEPRNIHRVDFKNNWVCFDASRISNVMIEKLAPILGSRLPSDHRLLEQFGMACKLRKQAFRVLIEFRC